MAWSPEGASSLFQSISINQVCQNLHLNNFKSEQYSLFPNKTILSKPKQFLNKLLAKIGNILKCLPQLVGTGDLLECLNPEVYSCIRHIRQVIRINPPSQENNQRMLQFLLKIEILNFLVLLKAGENQSKLKVCMLQLLTEVYQ